MRLIGRPHNKGCHFAIVTYVSEQWLLVNHFASAFVDIHRGPLVHFCFYHYVGKCGWILIFFHSCIRREGVIKSTVLPQMLRKGLQLHIQISQGSAATEKL